MDRSVEQHRVIVIGAGLAGLASAIFLSLNGYRVEVHEKAERAGGVALTRWDAELQVQGGLYFLLECFPGQAAFEVYNALGIAPWEGLEVVETYLEIVDQPTDARLLVTRDLDRLERDLFAIAPDDGKLISPFVDGARKFHDFDPAKASFEKPPELMGFLDKLALGWHARHALSVFMSADFMKKTIAEYAAPARSPALRELLQGFFPFTTVPPMFAMMVLGLLARGQLGRIVGSPETLIDRMVQRARDVGAELHFGSDVREILVEGGCARGVVLETGAEVRARAVVSTVDTGQLGDRLLGARVREGTTFEQWRTWEKAPPGAFVNFITSGDWEDRPWYTQARLRAPVRTGTASATHASVRMFRPGIAGAGAGECAVEVSLDAADHAWFERAGPEARAAFAAEVEARVDEIHPGFAARVKRREVVGPDVFARALSAPSGMTAAYLPTLAAMEVVSPRVVPGVDALYLAGQWAIAGAGALAVVYSGRNVAQLLCDADGRRFHHGDLD